MLLFKNLSSLFFSACAATVLSLALNSYTVLYSYNWWMGLIFFTALCLILNTLYALNARSKTFTELLMAGLIIKFLLSLVVIFLYSFFKQAGFFNFSIHFILQYILFTIFEIRYLLHIIKKHQTNTTTHEK